MRFVCRRFVYTCAKCRHEYARPGVDLSFFYGVFVGISINDETALVDSFADNLFDELVSYVDDGQEAQRILGGVIDPDSQGAPYMFSWPAPTCPQCGSHKCDGGEDTGFWHTETPAATHHRWDAMTGEQRAELVQRLLAQGR